MQAITNYRLSIPAADGEAYIPDVLNDFYACFEAQNDGWYEDNSAQSTHGRPLDQTTFFGLVIRGCADQLPDVLTDIFSISLNTTVIPTCFKATTIILVPKKSLVSCLSDDHPVTLNIHHNEVLLLMRYIKSQLPPSLDPLQFAYRPNKWCYHQNTSPDPHPPGEKGHNS